MTTVCAWLDLPDTLDAKRLRAGLMAADILPQVLHADARSWPHQLGSTPVGGGGVLIVDVSADVLAAVSSSLPPQAAASSASATKTAASVVQRRLPRSG